MLSFLPICNWFLSHLLSAVHGLSSIPLQQHQPYLASPSRREGVVTLPSHRPVERTRSEPPPYSHSPLTLHASHHSHIQHQLLQQYHKSGIERFKQNAHLSKVRCCTSMSHTSRETRTLSAICHMWLVLWSLCSWICPFKTFRNTEMIPYVIQILVKESSSNFKTCKQCKTSTLYQPTGKFLEKPRLTQIPSEDMDLEEIGSGTGSEPGSVCSSEPGSGPEDSFRRRQSTASIDSVYETESTTSSRESLIEPSHSISQVLI